MNLLTLGDLRSVVATPINLCPDDPMVASYINRAQERMMAEGDWIGTWQVYRICCNFSCLVWPRPIERITQLQVCDYPIPVRNAWYEFLENGPGYTSPNCGCGWQGIDQGMTCRFDDIITTAKKIKVYADVAETVGARILLRGHDENLNPIMTQDAGAWIEGEYVSINSVTPAVSTKKFCPPGPQIVLKPITNGPVRLFSYDDTVTPVVQVPIAVYEGGETRPMYRRTKIPGLASCETTECQQKTVTALVKLRHIEALSDLDTMVIQSREAFRMAAQAIRKEENNFFEEAQAYWHGFPSGPGGRRKGGAFGILQAELDNFLGPGAINPVRYPPAEIYGAAVCNLQ